MSLKMFWSIAPALLAAAGCSAPASERIASPNGSVVVEFALQPGGLPAYRIDYRGKPIVLASRLGFEPNFRNNFRVTGTSTSVHQAQWTNEWGERRIVPDNYRELNVDLEHASGKQMRLTFRAYDEGAALRYTFPAQDAKDLTFTSERTEFRFPEGTWGYEAHGTEGEYRRAPIASIRPQCERPLTLEYASGVFAALGEAQCVDYSRMLLSPLDGTPGALVSFLGGTTANVIDDPRRGAGGRPRGSDISVRLPLPGGGDIPAAGEAGPGGTGAGSLPNRGDVTIAPGVSSPWRFFIVANKPGDLLERNYLVLNLNPPTSFTDTSWITPGKGMRDVTLSTAGAKAVVDFASKLGFTYVALDWHWYGPDDTTDATRVAKDDLDIRDVAAYAKLRGMKVSLYLDYYQAKHQADVVFPLFKSEWGVDAVKIGFAAVGPQDETRAMTELIEKAATHRLVLNLHDGYRLTGNERTYPNVLTTEGVRGNEHDPTTEHNCTLPFTRFVVGRADYTPKYYRPRTTTSAHQLAMGVIAFSPQQWLLWRDRPSDYQEEPELEFWAKLPTVWDDTKVLHGKIGEYASIARRKDNAWFIGTITNSEPRELKLPLTFLDKDRRYAAHVYADDDAAPTRTKVTVTTQPVNAQTTLDVPLKAHGGHAVWIEPAR